MKDVEISRESLVPIYTASSSRTHPLHSYMIRDANPVGVEYE